MKRVWLGGIFAAAAFATAMSLVSPAHAISIGGLPIAGGLAGLSVGGLGSVTAVNVNSFMPDGTMPPQRFRDLKVVGRVTAPGAEAPKGSRLVRLYVSGRVIPLAIDNETASAVLEFGPNQRYAKDLYDAILTKRITVVGDDFSRTRIVDAAASQKPIVVEGYVFDRMSPYMVLKSVGSPQ